MARQGPKQTWWYRSQSDRASSFLTPTVINQGTEISAMAAPALIDLNNVLHFIFSEGGFAGNLFYLQF
jgi:hypothetical protein